MIAAIASGKGGTGKTTVAASLAAVWQGPLTVADLDVEAPNLHLFLKAEIAGRREISMMIPKVDESRCNYCGACSDICQFKAISVLGQVMLTLPEMCHGCGACMAVCPEEAISEDSRPLGEIIWGRRGDIDCFSGRLRVGEAMSPPLIGHVKDAAEKTASERSADLIYDAPPGVSCPAMKAVTGADIIVLVTEPTPFGLYDLKLAVNSFSAFKRPMGVVVNRAGIGNDEVYDYCRQKGLPLLAEIPFTRSAAEAYSKGLILAEAFEEHRERFAVLAEEIRRRCVCAGEVTA
ncbi:MAG: ATP-binding protein [Desulfobacterales bacterium]|nr:ATP-binding protein [Desulfobacterales bacterium]